MRIMFNVVLVLTWAFIASGIGCSSGDSGPELSCGTPLPPENGSAATCTGPLESGASCQYTCDPGFAVSGLTTCQNGILNPATCDPTGNASCDASTPPANGGVGDCTANLASGSSCQPTCNPPLTASGATLCDNGVLILSTVCQ